MQYILASATLAVRFLCWVQGRSFSLEIHFLHAYDIGMHARRRRLQDRSEVAELLIEVARRLVLALRCKLLDDPTIDDPPQQQAMDPFARGVGCWLLTAQAVA